MNYRKKIKHEATGSRIGATLAVLAVGAAVFYATQSATKPKRVRRAMVRDYSDRSGFPKGIEAARGLAKDFLVPRDMRAALPSPEHRANIH